jgi:hypothetical protein
MADFICSEISTREFIQGILREHYSLNRKRNAQRKCRIQIIEMLHPTRGLGGNYTFQTPPPISLDTQRIMDLI